MAVDTKAETHTCDSIADPAKVSQHTARHDAAVQIDLGITEFVSTEEAQQMLESVSSIASDRNAECLFAKFGAQLANFTAKMHDMETELELRQRCLDTNLTRPM